ncbi:hypothetical protein QQS21_002276 [Conoideocrella luteorostrata]|uniref:Uncharacterized protein n=1 Tax=Conoideocrella luteorostrata TaxID=1105319 RepID=A0AAJ0CVH6_9HYPO|nr:hypothetical protein QQS21_002276 [Conoideocrella luteorostrata]
MVINASSTSQPDTHQPNNYPQYYQTSMAETTFQRSKPLISSWSSTPIPRLSLSAAGLLALADLNTVAQRTVITGGSSWLDAFVLAPGLHYQQAVEALDQEFEPGLSAVLQSPKGTGAGDGDETRYSINNTAMAQYIRRIWQEANTKGVLTLNVGVTKDPAEQITNLKRMFSDFFTRINRKPPALPIQRNRLEIDWLSHVFYLASPILTIIAGAFMILLADWWGLAFIAALMVSRIFNIWSIKQRSRPSRAPALPPKTPGRPDSHGEYAIDLGNGSRIVLRGFKSDIQAVTTQMWLRQQTISESYLEAAAKLIVYLVAAFSGNQTQSGAMVLMALLLTSAGLLGLSNAHARGLQMNGRIARLQNAVEAVTRAAEVETAMDGETENGRLGGRLFEDLKKSVDGESDNAS